MAFNVYFSFDKPRYTKITYVALHCADSKFFLQGFTPAPPSCMDNNVNLSPSWEDRNAQQGSILQKLHSVQKLVGHIFSFHFGQSSTQKTTFVYNLIVQWAIIFDFKVL
jgi:hypothetical protein